MEDLIQVFLLIANLQEVFCKWRTSFGLPQMQDFFQTFYRYSKYSKERPCIDLPQTEDFLQVFKWWKTFFRTSRDTKSLKGLTQIESRLQVLHSWRSSYGSFTDGIPIPGLPQMEDFLQVLYRWRTSCRSTSDRKSQMENLSQVFHSLKTVYRWKTVFHRWNNSYKSFTDRIRSIGLQQMDDLLQVSQMTSSRSSIDRRPLSGLL